MASLKLGAFEMLAGDGSARVLAQGTSWGAPVPIEQAIDTFLQDGAIVVTQGHDNREFPIHTRFYGTNLAALGALEASLFAELEKPNTLTWTPDSGPVTVFDVITSSLTQDDESFVGEVQNKPWRTYVVRIVAAAFTRSATSFSSTALGAGGTTTTLLDACSATTGWTGTVDGGAVSPATAGGAVTLTATLPRGVSHTMALQKTFAATTTSTKLLVIDWKPPAGTVSNALTAVGDSVTLPVVAEAASPTSGYTRTWFYVAASSLAVTSLSLYTKYPGTPAQTVSLVFSVDNVAVSDVNPISGTGRQQIRSLTVPGSARTPGSLAIESASAALGDTLVYVYPDDTTTTGYSPPMRQFRSTGDTVVADSAQVSGSTETLFGNPVVFDVPIGLFPRGSYLLLGRLATSGGGTPTISYNARTMLNATILGSVTATQAITTTTAYQIFTIGRLNLPTVDLDPAAATAGVFMSLRVFSSAACTYDEFWLFNTTIGRLVQVACGTGAGAVGGSARRLFIEPPTVATPRPTVRIGHSADRTDSFYPATFPAWQFPEFRPPQVNVLTVTTNATDATVTLSGYARWHTNPAS